jgi:hypothetical protein
MISVLTLPFRLVFGILFGLIALPFALLAIPLALLYLPFLLLRLVVKALVGLVLLPFVLVAAVIAGFVALVAITLGVFVPMIVPLAFVGLCVWLALQAGVSDRGRLTQAP